MTKLTVDALSRTYSDCINKSASVKAFLYSQNKYTQNYAREGLKYASKWEKIDSSEAGKSSECQAPALIAKALGGGFSSPVLKPRHPSVVDGPCLLNKYISKDREPELKKRQRCDKGRKEKKVPLKRTKRKYASDEEREEILAQRRERRRHKKSITNPRQSSDGVESELDGGSEKGCHQASSGPEKSQKQDNKRSKKTEKVRLPAGLALMHGFNADNIGKNRLTMEPSVALGVFNKGKASAKTRPAKKKTIVTFNERGFLSKSKTSTTISKLDRKILKRVTPSTDIMEDNPTSSCNETLDRQRSRITSENRSQISSVSDAQERRSQKSKSDYASEIWEIEKEFLHLNKTKYKEPEKSGSIIVDTRKWNWGKSSDKSSSVVANSSQDVNGAPAINHTKKECLNHERLRMPSIAPSQSASQVPAREFIPQSPRTPQLKSKYFVLPESPKMHSYLSMAHTGIDSYDIKPHVCSSTKSHTEPLVSLNSPKATLNNLVTVGAKDTDARLSSAKDTHKIKRSKDDLPDKIVENHTRISTFRRNKEVHPEYHSIPASLLSEMITNEDKLLVNDAYEAMSCQTSPSYPNFESAFSPEEQYVERFSGCQDVINHSRKLSIWDEFDEGRVFEHDDVRYNEECMMTSSRFNDDINYCPEFRDDLESLDQVDLCDPRADERFFGELEQGSSAWFLDNTAGTAPTYSDTPDLREYSTMQVPIADECCHNLPSTTSYSGFELEDNIEDHIEPLCPPQILGSLKDVEMAVARDLQRRWYPVRY